jgi:hypothetical protein
LLEQRQIQPAHSLFLPLGRERSDRFISETVAAGATSPAERGRQAGWTLREDETMTLNDFPQGRLKVADSLRAALLGLVLRTLGDDYLELVEGTAPSEQRLDSANWMTDQEAQGDAAAKLDALIRDFEKGLAALGMRGVVYVASDGYLIDERHRIHGRLYGEAEGDRA